MPTLTRLVIFLALVAAVIYGAMYALANFVEPDMREITVEIPASKLKPVVIPAARSRTGSGGCFHPSDTPQE
ncbi:hypothetical protein HED49_01250 [Ochrobactrum daejeonense]|nr:hypothetical protein [Brucella daejeonensis]